MESREAPKEWAPPETMREAIERSDNLKMELKDIEVQLASRNRTSVDGSRYSPHEYWEWRDRARGAQAHKTKELMRLKRWIQDNQSMDEPRAIDLLHGCYAVLTRHLDAGYTENEEQIIRLAFQYLKQHGRKVKS